MASERNMEKAMMVLPGWVHEDATPYVAQALDDAERPLVEALRQLSATRGTSYARFIGALDATDALLAKYEVICDGPDTKTEDRAVFEDTLR